MRVLLPGRDYFPPRVLLRGAGPDPAMGGALRAVGPRGAWASRPIAFGWCLSLSPAMPPAPVVTLRPA